MPHCGKAALTEAMATMTAATIEDATCERNFSALRSGDSGGCGGWQQLDTPSGRKSWHGLLLATVAFSARQSPLASLDAEVEAMTLLQVMHRQLESWCQERIWKETG